MPIRKKSGNLSYAPRIFVSCSFELFLFYIFGVIAARKREIRGLLQIGKEKMFRRRKEKNEKSLDIVV